MRGLCGLLAWVVSFSFQGSKRIISEENTTMTTARDVLRSTEDSSCNAKDTMTTSTDELKELRLASTLPQRQDSTERCLLLCRRSSFGQKQTTPAWTLENENDGKD